MSPRNATRQRLIESFDSFSVVPFRWIWFAALSGNAGRYALVLVAGWDSYRIGGHSAIWPSMVSFLLLIPTTFFGIVAGSFADRVNRALLSSLGQTVNACAALTCAALVVGHDLSLPALMVLVGVVGVGNAIQGPAWQSLVPAIVGHERMTNAAAATRIAQQGSELVGPAIGTAVLTTAGPGATFLLVGVFYACAAVMFSRVMSAAPPVHHPEARPSLVRQVGQGFTYIGNSTTLRMLFFWVTCHCCLTMASLGILPTIASVNFHGQAAIYGLMLTFFGVGSIIGPLALMAFGARRSASWMLFTTGLLSGLSLVGLGLTHVPALALLMAGLAGFGQSGFMALIYGFVMTNSSEHVRGRVASIELSITSGTMGAASLGWGALVSVMSAGLVLAAPGLVFTAVCLALVGKFGSLDKRLIAQAKRIGEEAFTILGPAPAD